VIGKNVERVGRIAFHEVTSKRVAMRFWPTVASGPIFCASLYVSLYGVCI